MKFLPHIAGATDDDISDTSRIAAMVQQLDRHTDIEFDEYGRAVSLTDSGLQHARERLTMP